MTITVEGLGPVVDLAKAIGLVGSDDQLDKTWFSSPGDHVSRVLRDPGQRAALLRAANQLIEHGTTPFTDTTGRRWIRVFDEGGVTINVVVGTSGTTTDIGIGARLGTASPISETLVYVPLLHVPETGPISIPFADGSGTITLSSEITLDIAPPPPGELGLGGLRVAANIATDGTAPTLAITLVGLQLPGQTTPADVSLGGDPSQIGQQAIRLLFGLIQHSVAGAVGDLAELLALVGITDDTAIPELPIVAMVDHGVSAWREWLDALIGSPTAVAAWLSHLHQLVGHGSVLDLAPAPGLPNRISWTLANGLTLAAVIRVARTAAGAPLIELGAEARLATNGPPAGSIELSTTLVRITLGDSPAVAGLPSLELAARLGPRTLTTAPFNGLLAVATPTLQVGSLRTGFTLGEDRRLAFVLAAHGVVIGAHSYATLDLTNAQTLADVATTAVSDIAAAVFNRLGPAGTAIKVVTGIDAPSTDPNWPASLRTALPDLLADPVRAVRTYHTRVIAERRAGYKDVLDPLRALLAPAGFTVPISGTGVESAPWRLALASGVGVDVWTTNDTLELAISAEKSLANLGGGCPTATVRVVARIASIALDGSGAHAVPGAFAQFVFGARGGVPIRIGDETAAIVADTAGVDLRWERDRGLNAQVLVPGLAAVVDGETVPITLPTLSANGTLVGQIPWRAFELLIGHVVHRLGLPWTDTLTSLLGWVPSNDAVAADRLPLEALFADPLAALRAWAMARLRRGDLIDLARAVATAIGGPTVGGVSVSVIRGRGDARSPLTIPLNFLSADAAFRTELLLWSPARPFAARRTLPSVADLAGGVGYIEGALREAAVDSRTIDEALRDRADLSTGLSTLAARWTGSDGLVRSADAALPDASVHTLPNVGHLELVGVDVGMVCGAVVGPLTLFVVGPSGPDAWPGVEADHAIDLRAAGLVPEAFDLSRLATETGPWLVQLASRADSAVAPSDDGAARQAARLSRVVDALAARANAAEGEGVTIVAHGAAGHAAAAAAGRPGVIQLVTLGTAHGGIDLSILDAQPGAGALRLLASLTPPRDADATESPDVSRGRALLDAMASAYDAPDRALDLAPPVTAPTIPPSVDVHCVRGQYDEDVVMRAVASLASLAVAHDVETELATVGGTYAAPTSALGAGIAVTIEPPSAPGALHFSAQLSFAGTMLDGATPAGVHARIGIGRAGGWLAGGPDLARPTGVARDPSLRRADIEVDLRVDGTASAQIVLHEARALGVERTRWVIDSSAGDALLPEMRLLIGRMAAGLGAIPATGPLRGFAELLDALGLIDAATPVTTGALIGLSVDGVRRLAVDPAGLFSDASAAANVAALTRALAAFVGAPAPTAAAPTRLAVQVDGVTITVDVAMRKVGASVTTLQLASGVALTGGVELGANGRFSGDVGLALGPGMGPNGRPVIELEFGAATRLALRWQGGGSAFVAPIELAPVPDTAGLSRLLTTAVPAYVLWAGLTFVRSLQPGAVALIDPVLRIAGLLVGTGTDERVIVPMALVADPVHWFTHPDLFGDATGTTDVARIRGLLDVVARMVGIPQPAGGGAWQLPFGLALGARTESGRAALALDLDAPVPNTPLRVAGSLALLLPAGALPASPSATLMLALPGAAPVSASGRVQVAVGPSGLSIRLILPATNVDLQLVPFSGGLADLGGAATAAATYALPFVLDAIAGLPAGHTLRPVAVALGDVGDALGLRTAGKFDAAQIQQLAANPGPQLAQRLSQNLPTAIDAIVALVGPAIPAGYSVARDVGDLVFRHTGTLPFEVRVTVPTGASLAGARLAVTLDGVRPFTGATIGGSLTVDATGLAAARVSFGVDPAQGFALGPLTLAPIAEVVIGNAAPGGARVSAGLAVDATRSVSGVLRLAPTPSFALEAAGGTMAENIARLLLPPAVDLAMSTTEMTQLMGLSVLGGPTIRELLDGVVFNGVNFDPGIVDVSQLWNRLIRLLDNVAGHSPTLIVEGLTIRLSRRPAGGDQVYGVSLSLAPGGRLRLADGDVKVDLEVDASWITGGIPEGILIEPLRVQGTALQPFFGISIAGVGVRVSKGEGPLLDTVITIDSIALHPLFAVDLTGITAAGGQLELGGFAVGLGSAGGSNKVASGIMKDSASGATKPEPKLSPALAVQRHGTGGLNVSLRAGEGDGPWWVRIQRAFGPVYIEQVGFGVTRQNNTVVGARVIVDGHVSMMGLLVAVDDLAVGVRWPQLPADPPLYDPSAWEIDLAGLAVAANMSGVVIAGGLRRSPGPLPDYLGMVSIRFSVYGISAYGGYAVVEDAQGRYTSLFLYGAVSAPIGGVPAFFLTGIGAGIGINRKLILPTDLNQFPSFPFLQALDRSAPMVDPEQALDLMQVSFPVSRGAFWLAAGISFNSFSLVDGIIVIAVAVGDGLEINLLGLARAGLPNPSAPIVMIELALVARFSTKDGILWIQAQLTDNSWLLTRDCRLTGGFAFVMWFKGDKNGQFVVTLGGYHPSFHRDGYPVVPRLGLVWTVSSFLVIKGETYFALTSEAIMLGTRIEASLTLGLLWAYLRLGADGIVYFDPFHFEVTAFAELGAGITIDVDLGWFGHVRITITIHLHADVLLEGPEFRGRATVDLDVTSATIEFGEWADRSTAMLSWSEFDAKYIRPGGAAMLTVVPGRGVVPPSGADSKKAPTGGATDPYLVVPEFVLSVTTTAATTVLNANGPHSPAFPVVLAIGPMHLASVTSTLTLTVQTAAGTEYVDRLDPTVTTGQFPKGAWAPQSQAEPKPIPKGDTVGAVNGAILTASANIPQGTVPIDSRQVEIGARLPLPFLVEAAVRASRAADAQAAAAFVAAQPTETGAVLSRAHELRTQGANGSPLRPLSEATFRRERTAPPQLVPLTYRLAIDPAEAVTVPQRIAATNGTRIDTGAHEPQVDTLITIAATAPEAPKVRTTVGAAGDKAPRVTPRTLAEVKAASDPRVPAKLVTVGAPAARRDATVIAAARSPSSGRAGGGTELRRHAGQAPWKTKRLDAASAALTKKGADLSAGVLALLTMDNGHYDIEAERPSIQVSGNVPVRVITLDTAGNVTLDATAGGRAVTVPVQTDRIALLAGAGSDGAGASGWHSGSRLVQLGARSLAGSGCTVVTSGVVSRRRGVRVATGFVTAADAVDGYSIVTTRLPANVTAVAIVLEPLGRVDDDRGDVLELGLAGADRALGRTGEPLPPTVVEAGRRLIHVYDVVPSDAKVGAGAVEVTVASGEHFHLGGVIGARTDASTLADSLTRRDLGSLVGQLVRTREGAARVRWIPQPAATR